MTTKHTEQSELLRAHLAAMNSLSDFVKAPSLERDQAMRKAEATFRALLAKDTSGGEVVEKEKFCTFPDCKCPMDPGPEDD